MRVTYLARSRKACASDFKEAGMALWRDLQIAYIPANLLIGPQHAELSFWWALAALEPSLWLSHDSCSRFDPAQLHLAAPLSVCVRALGEEGGGGWADACGR